MSLEDLWRDVAEPEEQDEALKGRRRLQTEAARIARAVQRAKQKTEVVVPPGLDETFSERLQREHMTSAGYAHARKHEFAETDARHAQARERGRCVKSFLQAMAAAVTSLFLGSGRSGADKELGHVVNMITSDDTSTRLRSHRNDTCDVFTIMNTNQSLFFRYSSGRCESLCLPSPLQVLPGGKAEHIHAAFKAWLAVSSSGIGPKLLSLQCPADLNGVPKHQTLVLMGDALKANDSAWKLERERLVAKRAGMDNAADVAR